MKILHIHPSLASGGIEAMICGLANEMAKTNDVTVCSLFEPHSNDLFWTRLSPRVNRINLGKTKEGFSLKTILKIVQLIRRGGFDVVNLHGFFYYYVLAVYTCREKTQFFYTVHSDANMENGSWSKYVFRLKKNAFIKGYVHPITISPASDMSFKNLYGINGKIIENGVSRPLVSDYSSLIEGARITPKTKVFVHPGRITEAKNQLVLCQVFQSLINEGSDVALIIAGNKKDISIFNAIQPYFCNRIKYVGEREDILTLLSQCDGMCLPSKWEGLPVTLLESLSVGCVPICSPVGGIVNVICDGVNGILSKSSNYQDYLAAIKIYLGLPDSEVKRMKLNAKKSFAPYDISVSAAKYLEYYHSYTNRPKEPLI